ALAVAVAVGPVLQIGVHPQALLRGIVHRAADVFQVLLQGLAELPGTVLLTALDQKVDHLAAGFADPVDAVAVVDEAEHLHALAEAAAPGPVIDTGDGLLLARRYPRRGDLDTIDPQRLEQ